MRTHGIVGYYWRSTVSLRAIAGLLLSLAACFTAAPAHGRDSIFEIIEGQDEAVCRSYELALETLVGRDPAFAERPWCNGDVNPSVDGFPSLERRYVTDLDEAFTLRYQIRSFLSSQDQYGYTWQRALKDREENRRWTERALQMKQLQMWRYVPPLDIDNDGKPDNVLWYREGRCNSLRPIVSAALIMDPKSHVIDIQDTRRFFGEAQPYPVKTERFIQLRGGSVGVFAYRKHNYVYAWGDDKAWARDSSSNITVRVMLWQGPKVSTVCEVRWNKGKM